MNTEMKLKTMNVIHDARKFLQSDAPDYKKSAVEATLYMLSQDGVNSDKDATRILFDTSVHGRVHGNIECGLTNLLSEIR